MSLFTGRIYIRLSPFQIQIGDWGDVIKFWLIIITSVILLVICKFLYYDRRKLNKGEKNYDSNKSKNQ